MLPAASSRSVILLTGLSSRVFYVRLGGAGREYYFYIIVHLKSNAKFTLIF